jgi:hypothetical protein
MVHIRWGTMTVCFAVPIPKEMNGTVSSWQQLQLSYHLVQTFTTREINQCKDGHITTQHRGILPCWYHWYVLEVILLKQNHANGDKYVNKDLVDNGASCKTIIIGSTNIQAIITKNNSRQWVASQSTHAPVEVLEGIMEAAKSGIICSRYSNDRFSPKMKSLY